MPFSSKYQLQQTEHGLEVVAPTLSRHPYRIDFIDGKQCARLTPQNLSQELLIKAIGGMQNVRVLDATAGLGRDSLLLAQAVQELVCLERHPEIFQLLSDALTRLKQDAPMMPIAGKMSLHEQCAIQYLQSYQGPPFDIIYCDPMFPPKRKSALNKKESQILQTIVGADPDSDDLIKLALQHAQSRVVVKRPLYAGTSNPPPDIQFKGRAHRFDVYLQLNRN